MALASDLVAVGETLGLDICAGLNSGSVVGTLDPIAHGFYDLVGDVVSSATLMAELAMAGQVRRCLVTLTVSSWSLQPAPPGAPRVSTLEADP